MMGEKYIWELEADKEEKRKKKLEKLKEKKIREIKREKKRKRKKRIYKIMKILTLVVTILALILIPIIPIKEVEITGNINFTEENTKDDLNFKDKESIISFNYKKIKNKKFNPNYNELRYEYSLGDGKLKVTVDESKPLSHDEKGKNFILNSNKIKETEYVFATPLLLNFSEKEIQEINEELLTLDFGIITQIQSIKYSDKEKKILQLHMYDGNDIYIYVQQISEKMPYYPQMKDIIAENNKGAGNIYLYIGDYYEEK